MQTLQEANDDSTRVPEEEEVTREHMETDSFLYDNLNVDILSDAGLFCKNYEGMFKLDNVILQKSKDFILWKRVVMQP